MNFVEMNLIPLGHKKCEEKHIDALKTPMGNPKGFSLRACMKVASKEVS
jgi:hypothetical protein